MIELLERGKVRTLINKPITRECYWENGSNWIKEVEGTQFYLTEGSGTVPLKLWIT